MRSSHWRGCGAGVAALLAAGCGARTGLYIPPPAPPPPECYVTSDCEGAEDLCAPVVCQPLEAGGGSGGTAGAGGAGGLGGTGGVGGLGGAGAGGSPQTLVGGTCVKLAPVDCDDGDPCTKDRCEPWSGQCLYDLATLDLDGDGFRGPRPGTKAGDPDACGDDCDDANENAYPGGTEICDGVDNDCNGIVDDNAEYLPGSVTVKVSDGPIDPAGPGGLGHTDDGKYFALYTGTDGGFRMYKRRIGDGAELLTDQELYRDESLTGDAYGGPMIWVGDRYGVLWQDRTPGDYEIYFSLADQEGTIAFPGPVRLSFASGFSINPSLSWNGTEFIAVWQDERTGIFELFAQKLDVDAKPIGDNIQLTDQDSGFGNEAPSVAAGVQTIGVAWNIGDASTHFVRFRTFDLELQPIGETLSLTDGQTSAVYPVVVWNKDRYVVAWFDKTASPAAIYAATLDEEGNLLAGPQPITSPGSAHSRYPNLRPLGDRTLLVYSDDRDGNDGYELYSMIFDNDLQPLTPELRVTNAPRDSIYPTVAFGKEGAVGVLFRDDRENGQPHVYFTQLGCSAGGPP